MQDFSCIVGLHRQKLADPSFQPQSDSCHGSFFLFKACVVQYIPSRSSVKFQKSLFKKNHYFDSAVSFKYSYKMHIHMHDYWMGCPLMLGNSENRVVFPYLGCQQDQSKAVVLTSLDDSESHLLCLFPLSSKRQNQ